MIIVDLLRYICPKLAYVCKIAFRNCLESGSQRKKASGHEPLRHHVLRGICKEHFIRNLTHKDLKFLEVGGAAVFHL